MTSQKCHTVLWYILSFVNLSIQGLMDSYHIIVDPSHKWVMYFIDEPYSDNVFFHICPSYSFPASPSGSGTGISLAQSFDRQLPRCPSTIYRVQPLDRTSAAVQRINSGLLWDDPRTVSATSVPRATAERFWTFGRQFLQTSFTVFEPGFCDTSLRS